MNTKPRSRYPFSIIRERIGSHPGPVLDFAFGGLQTPPPEAVRSLLREQSGAALIRAKAAEIERLTDAAARWFSSLFGTPVASRAILPCPGGRMALNALASALLTPGDTVVVTEPTYPVFSRLATRLHARVLELPLDPDRGFEPDLNGLVPGAANDSRILALNYPNNPTGVVPTSRALDRFRQGVGQETIWFNDATYAPLSYTSPPFSLLTAEIRHPVVELHSLAKFFALGPLSVAFLVGDEPVVSRVRDYSEFAWSPMSSLQVAVARHCLEDRGHVAEFLRSTRERVMRLRTALDSLGFETFEPQAGMYLLCRAPSRVAGKPVTSATEAAKALLDDHDIAVVPWEVPPHGYLRFSGMYRDEELEALKQKRDGVLVSA